MRKRYSPSLKANLVLQLLKEEKGLSELASEHGIHPNQLRDWKKTAVEGLPSLFTREQKNKQAAETAYEQKIEELYTEIGRLSTQLAWLKKKSGRNGESS